MGATHKYTIRTQSIRETYSDFGLLNENGAKSL